MVGDEGGGDGGGDGDQGEEIKTVTKKEEKQMVMLIFNLTQILMKLKLLMRKLKLPMRKQNLNPLRNLT